MDLLSLDSLPSVSLVQGNLSQEYIDNMMHQLINKLEVQLVDFLYVPSLTIETAQMVHSFSAFEPVGSLKLVVLNMAKATTRAQNSLLTLLECPPIRVKFVLFSTFSVLDTIKSRCEVFNVGIDAEPSKQAKTTVLAVLKAVSELNDIVLEDLFKNWDEEASALLLEWAIESYIKKPKNFSQEELSFAFPKGFQESLILALSTSWAARGRFSVKSMMLSFVGRSKGIR